MVPLSPQALIIAAQTLAFTGAQDDCTFGDPPPARPVDEIPPEGSKDRWDLRFVDRCGYMSHYDHGGRASSWPLPMDLTHAELAEFARRERLLRDEPAPGDVFLAGHPRTRVLVQAGVIVTVGAKGRYDKWNRYFDAYTIVGDTDETGLPGRGRVMRFNRRLLPAQGDLFIRWSDMDANGGMIRYDRSTFIRDAQLRQPQQGVAS